MPLLASIVAALCPRARPQLSALCLRDCLSCVVVQGTLPIGVDYLGRSELHPALVLRISNTDHCFTWYLHSSGISGAKINDVKWMMILFVEHQAPSSSVNCITAWPGLPQALHTRHVSQTPLIRLSVTLSRPASVKSRILSSSAWKHRKCSFRNSRVTTL
eukprot:2096967-Pyramimonas_sp.AAC.1